MTASDAVTQAVMAANITGHDAWIVVDDGTLKVTQSVDIAIKFQVVEIIHPTGQKNEVL